jgi:hypothetical protein
MRQRLHNYSQILQLDTQTMLNYKHAPDGLARALQMFFVITLLAGLGVWLGIPVQVDKPILYETLMDTQLSVDQFARSVKPYLQGALPIIPEAETLAETVGNAAVGASETINKLLEAAEVEAKVVEPPLGVRTSRVIRLFGRWLSVPFAVMANQIVFVLVAMAVAKLIGGRATLSQHLTAVLLSVAPLLLLLPTYIPDLAPVVPITFAIAISLFARILALVGYAWAALILLKGLALSHEFSWWRALATLLLSMVVVYLIPVALSIYAGYLLLF